MLPVAVVKVTAVIDPATADSVNDTPFNMFCT